jgi:hypothetical protein
MLCISDELRPSSSSPAVRGGGGEIAMSCDDYLSPP